MALAQAAPIGTWGNSFLPLNRPMLQVPFARSRAIRLGELADNLPPQLEKRFSSEQLQALLKNFPASYASLANLRKQRKTTTTSAQTSTTTTSTTTTTTTPKPEIILPRRRRPPQPRNDVPKFHYGGLEGREDYAVGPAEDDAIVLLVGLFNLLAIVVYAASKFVMGKPESLSDRVIQWQVQKVLDELVIKVHSSQHVANLLSRAMPDEGQMFEEGRKVDDLGIPSWVNVLQRRIQQSSLQNTSKETTAWLSKVKDRLMTEIGSSPAAISTARLHPQIYKPLKGIYATLSTEDGLNHLLKNVVSESETGRSFAAMKDIPGLMKTISSLTLEQIQSMLTTLTVLGRAQQRVNILPILMAVMKGHNGVEGDTDSSLVETGRVISESDSFDSFVEAMAQSYQPSRPKPRGQNQEHRTRYSRLIETNIQGNGEGSVADHTSRRGKTKQQGHRPSSQLVKRQGMVADESSAAPTGHWTDRWFSLVTQLAPVGLDITTLYARARARPACLRALLCRANNAWRQVGPVQASLTPFTSVLVSWLLEDTTPHSLGDSLIAIRAGWMGKDCSIHYPECPLQPDPHPAAKEAITFFSRLQYAATGPAENSLGASGTQSATSDTAQGNSDARPANNQHDKQTTNGGGGIDRIDSQSLYAQNQNNAYPNQSPLTQYQDHPMATNSLRPPLNIRLPSAEQELFPQRRPPMKEGDDNAAALQAYYNRYQGQGPMVVPGSQYSSKYGHLEDRDPPQKMKNELYEKYDSPSSNSAEGEISGSNSVAGMALQDRPTGHNNKVWEEFFNAGLYGSSVPQTSLNNKEESPSITDAEKPTRQRKPMKRLMSTSLNKMGAALPPNQHSFYNNPSYPNYNKNPTKPNNPGYPSYNKGSPKPNNPGYSTYNKGSPKPNRPNNGARPYFTLRPLRTQTTRAPISRDPSSSVTPFIKKYKWGLRRGLPASNVNGYNAYLTNSGNLYQRQKPWHNYHNNVRHRQTLTTTLKPPVTTTTVSTSPHPLSSKDVAPFGPEDAVTDVLRNDLLYEYIRDRQGSIPIEDKKRSLT